MKRWLWGLLVMGLALVVTSGRVYGKPGPGSPPPAPVAVAQVHIPPFAAPSSMPALGEELARGLYAALRDSNIPARLGKGDEGSAIVGRLEELSQAQVRLQASYHGHSVQSVGDLEHLDDLVYAVFTQLRPRLQLAVDTRSGGLEPPAATSDAPPATVVGSALPMPPTADTSPARPSAAIKEAVTDSAPTAPVRLASVKDVTATHTSRTSTSHRPTEARPVDPAPATVTSPAPAAKESKEPVVASAPPSLPSPPTISEPVAEAPRVASVPQVPPVPIKTPSTPRPPLAAFPFDPRRPRVAVHVVGEPLARIPAGYSGLGAVGQQSLISYLQQRLRIPAVASRLVGLTGGLAALDQSLRVGARHTLMVRLDGLVLSPSPSSGPMPGGGFTGGTLSGRIHVVLLLDGKLLLDRSVMLPPTLVLPSETPAQAYARSLFAAMDSVAGELAARLSESLGGASTAAGPPRSP